MKPFIPVNQQHADARSPQMDASDEVDDAFPDALREPILRKIQFSTVSRLDNLGMYSHSSLTWHC